MVDQVNVCAITIHSSENRYDVLPNHFPNSHPTGWEEDEALGSILFWEEDEQGPFYFEK